jgi:hypothetical protein
MKRLLILTILGMLLGGVAGCRFMDCLWRGGPCQQNAQPACANPCGTPCATVGTPCDPCCGGGAPATVMPGPATYVPVNPR